MTITIAETIKIHHATKAKAEKLADMLEAEYPALQLSYDANEDESQIRQWLVVHVAGDDSPVILETDKVPELAKILAVCEDLDIDPEEGYEDEGPSGSVVPDGYRKLYRQISSTKQSCGDWLAEQLAVDTRNGDGFMEEDFQAVLDNNEVDQSGKWASLPKSGQSGWVGRWRMNGRQALEKRVALTGVYFDVAGAEHKPDPEWLTTKQRQHAKWIEKQRKAEAAADALAG